MAVLLFPSKVPGSTITLTFPFAGQMIFGELAIGLSVNVDVFTGTDASPTALLLGTPAFDASNTKVLQQIQGGLPGVTYTVIGAMTTDAGNIYTVTGRLAVVESLGQFA